MMKEALGKCELFFYFVSWTSSNIFSLHYLFAVQEELYHNGTLAFTNRTDLQKGWKALSRWQDVSDPEWSTWKHYIGMSWFPLAVHFLGSEVLRNWNKSLVTYWYIIFTLSFTFLKFGFVLMALTTFLPLIYVSTSNVCRTKAHVAVWTVSIIVLPGLNWLKSSYFIWEFMDTWKDEDVYLIFICAGWIQARCISFCFDQINHCNAVTESDKTKRQKKYISEVIQILAYSLYFPTFFTGPFILYSDFKKSYSLTQESLPSRLRRAIKSISIIITYACLMDVTLHYIYFMALKSDIKYVRSLPSMALCGAGLWMGVQFHLKYVVMYGTAGAWAALDHVDAPPTPRCVLRIHLYSHMWKYFDVGLYQFLILYIYKPVLNAISCLRISTTVKKMTASFVTFVFVFFWHGATLSIFIWDVLNYTGVLLENLGSVIGKTELYANFSKTYLRTAGMEERFKAFISTPLLTMSALSNFYLFADVDVGNTFVERFLSESWYNILFIYFCLYTCCHVSMALSDVPSRTARYKNKSHL